MVLPIIDLAGCCIVLWTILQTRKNLGAGSSADGKGKKNIRKKYKRMNSSFFLISMTEIIIQLYITEADILSKYKLWSSFYIVTLVYVYVTRIIVQLLQASLPFRYVTWLGEAVNEFATFLFYIYIGYKFRPYPNNPYTQVPGGEDEQNNQNDDIELRIGSPEDNNGAIRLYPVSRARTTPPPK